MQSITVQVPPNFAGTPVDVTVGSGGSESIVKGVFVVPALPGIFQLSQSGKSAAVLLHSDDSLADGFALFPLIVGVDHKGAALQAIICEECEGGIAELRFEVPQQTPSGNSISLPVAVFANGKTMYSNESATAIQ